MSTLLGRFRIVPEGPYNPDKEYKYLSRVTSEGNAYLYINHTPGAGKPLNDGDYWLLDASKGDKGDMGDVTPEAEAARDVAQGYASEAQGYASEAQGYASEAQGHARQLEAGVASPAGVYADLAALNSADPDHDKVYLTLDDGKWNYWDGSVFVAGGVYQAAGLPDELEDNVDFLIAKYTDSLALNGDGFEFLHASINNISGEIGWGDANNIIVSKAISTYGLKSGHIEYESGLKAVALYYDREGVFIESTGWKNQEDIVLVKNCIVRIAAAYDNDGKINNVSSVADNVDLFLDRSYSEYAGSGESDILENVIVNGNMRDGTDNWITYGGRSSFSVNNGALKIETTGNSGAYAYGGQCGHFSIPESRKILIFCTGKASKKATVTMRCTGAGFKGDYTDNFKSTYSTTFHDYYSIVETNNEVSCFRFSAVGLKKEGDWLEVKNVVVIDLTKAFGAGNEPSADYVYANLLDQLDDKHFSDFRGLNKDRNKVLHATEIPIKNTQHVFDAKTVEGALEELAQACAELEPPDTKGFDLNLSAVVLTDQEPERNTYPVLWGVKLSNARDWKEPETLGWLYYDPAPPYDMYYATGRPDNLVKISTWDLEIAEGEPWNYQPIITPDGDILMIWRGQLAASAEDARKNPLLYPVGNYDSPVAIDFSDSIAPSAPFNNVGYDYIHSEDILVFGEYTRPVHDFCFAWKVTKPWATVANWTRTKTFSVISGSGSEADEIKHIHCMNYDPFSKNIYMGTGDLGTSPLIYKSDDFGSTWTLVNGPSESECRTLNFIFTKDACYWATDSPIPEHFLWMAPRDQNNEPDFSSKVALYQFPKSHATYGTVRTYTPDGLLFLNRFDAAKTDPTNVQFWSFELERMFLIKQIPPIDDGNSYHTGFRCDAQQMYQAVSDNRILVGFKTWPNYMDVFGNLVEDNVCNLSLVVLKSCF